MPVRVERDPVDVLLELPRQPRLADAGDAGDRYEMRAPLLGTRVEEILDLAQLRVAADERCLEAGPLERTLTPGNDAERSPETDRLRLPLELVLAGRGVRDRGLARPASRVTDEHRPGLRRGLDARGRVDEVSGDHPLALRTQRHRRLTRKHAGAGTQIACADLVAQPRHRRHQVERRAHRTLGVVLRRHRRPPHGHHSVTDELLHRAAVQLDQTPTGVEVPRQQLTCFLGVAALGERRVADEVGEQHRDEATFRDPCVRRSGGLLVTDRYKGHSTLAAELHAGCIRRAAREAGEGEARAALAAELPPRLVGRPACVAVHRSTLADICLERNRLHPARLGRMSTPPPRVKPGVSADAEAAGRRDAVREAERRWWRRTIEVLRRPRDVFTALAEDDEDDVVARQEPILAIVLLAGIGGILLTPAWGTLFDDSSVDWLVLAVVTFVGGLFYGAFGYLLLGIAVWLGARGAGATESARQARHVLAFSVVPLALSPVVTVPVALVGYGGDFFRSGGADGGAGRAVVVGLGLAFVAWSAGLLALGLRTTYRLPWRGVAGALALSAVLVAAFAVLPSAL